MEGVKIQKRIVIINTFYFYTFKEYFLIFFSCLLKYIENVITVFVRIAVILYNRVPIENK